MRFFRKRFGVEKLAITEKDERLIYKQLREIDENRLELFAYISLVAISVMLILDVVYFDEKQRRFYVTFDSLFWLISFCMILIPALFRKKGGTALLNLKNWVFEIFPLFWLIWATAICALDPTSLLNIITFYFILFLFAFAVITSFKRFLFYYVIIFSEYIFIKVVIDQPILTENTVSMLIVCGLVLPFYHSFRSARVTSQAALIILNDQKKNLEDEVAVSNRELLILNSNLNDEIRQRKIVESKIRETLKLAESNSQLKSEFLANISHEIRTPLNAIIGFSEMLTEESVSVQRKKEFQEMIETNTGLLLSTIDDIFDASLIKTEQITPIEKHFVVNSFLRNLTYDLNSIALKYNNRHIDMVINPSPDEELTILTDEYYLKKALIRLADNAYKFTEQGRIEIGVFKGEGDTIEFYVSDTGIGIPEKDYIKIFEPFVQGDGSMTRDFGGSGLGLTIAKGISRALGATLNFSSKIGSGSRFSMSFCKDIIKS
jgi:signal transduction histidine kinase